MEPRRRDDVAGVTSALLTGALGVAGGAVRQATAPRRAITSRVLDYPDDCEMPIKKFFDRTTPGPAGTSTRAVVSLQERWVFLRLSSEEAGEHELAMTPDEARHLSNALWVAAGSATKNPID
jgi:hypothetical protein